MKNIILLFITICFTFSCKHVESNRNNHTVVEDDFAEKFTPIIEEVIKTHSIPGLSIGIVHNNQIIYAKGFGYTNIENKKPISINTMFHVASISKVFVATAIMQLVEEGKIDLDEKLISYLPDFKLKGDSYKEITIRQMLGHYSGMPNSNDYNWDKPEYDNEALERYVRTLEDFEMEYAPGEIFRYSNIAFEVLGHLIAKVSGTSFCDYQKEMVLKKAGMPNSSFLKPKELPDTWASPHVVGIEPFVLNTYPFNRRHAPSSTLHTNTAEMCNWMLVNLNKGSYKQYQILSEQSMDSLWTQQIAYEMGGVGLSWFIGDYRGNRKISHDGDDEGFQASLTLLPGQSIGIIIMANTLPAPLDEISNLAMDILLEQSPVPIKPLISVESMKILNIKGQDEAVAYWKEMELKHAEEYDFSSNQHFNLYFATIFDREDEAIKIAEFYNKVLKTEEKEYLMELMQYALSKKPENELPLKIIEKLKN